MSNENNDLPEQASSDGRATESVPLMFLKAADLVPYARNARTHSEEQLTELAGMIRHFGWTDPLLVEGTSIVAGHGRLKVALRLYEKGESIRLPGGNALPPGTVPCIDVSGWSESDKRAFILAHNNIALKAGWDEELVKLELFDLDEAGLDTLLTGFDIADISRIMGEETPVPKSSGADDLSEFNYQPKFGVTVVCKSEAEQEAVYTKLVELGYDAKCVNT